MPTMGMEIELPNVARTCLSTLSSVTRCQYEVHDDGSIRARNYGFEGISVTPMNVGDREIFPSGSRELDRQGLELVTRPYSAEAMREYARDFSDIFCKVPDTSRASVHIHIDMAGKPWKVVQNFVRWFYYLEAPLYRLSSLRRKHRGTERFHGMEQDYQYCRPLSNPIGIMEGRKDKYVPLVNISKFLSATYASEMLAYWGRLDYYWRNLTHYSAHRLHGINIVPLQTHGTIELRIFNGVYRYLEDVVQIALGLYNLALGGEPDFSPMILGAEPNFSAGDMSRLLNWNVEHIWGWQWPRACNISFLAGHYNNTPPMPLLENDGICLIYNNNKRDDKSVDFQVVQGDS